jgi:quinol monooxygenase YgiN
MIIVAGDIFIPADKRDACLTASAALQQASRYDEPGCMAYSFGTDPCRDDVIVVYELWDTAENLAAHFLHPNYMNMRAKLGEMGITGAEVLKHRVDASAPVYNTDGIATTDF